MYTAPGLYAVKNSNAHVSSKVPTERFLDMIRLILRVR